MERAVWNDDDDEPLLVVLERFDAEAPSWSSDGKATEKLRLL